MSLTPDEMNALRRLISEVQPLCTFGFSETEVKEITQKVGFLTLEEKGTLLSKKTVAFGSYLYDAGQLLNTKIAIDDYSSLERERHPYAHLIHENYAEPGEDLVETIDIFRSLSKDALFLGHPVLVFAISRWTRLAMAGKYIKRKRARHAEKEELEIDFDLYHEPADRAARYLKEIQRAFAAGIKNRSLDAMAAVERDMDSLGLQDHNTYLYLAWQCLHKDWIETNCPGAHEPTARIESIGKHLNRSPVEHGFNKNRRGEWFAGSNTNSQAPEKVFNDSISIRDVIDFLKGDGIRFVSATTKGGKVYVTDRPKYKAFSNAFFAWFAVKKSSTLNDYHKHVTNAEPATASNFLEQENEKEVFAILEGILSSRTSAARDPVKLADSDPYDIEKRIIQMGVK